MPFLDPPLTFHYLFLSQIHFTVEKTKELSVFDRQFPNYLPLYFQKNAIRSRRYGGRTGCPRGTHSSPKCRPDSICSTLALLVTRESVDRTEQSLQQEEHPVP